MVVRAYAVCIGVTPECRRTESEMIGDGRGRADKVDEAYHDTIRKSCIVYNEMFYIKWVTRACLV